MSDNVIDFNEAKSSVEAQKDESPILRIEHDYPRLCRCIKFEFSVRERRITCRECKRTLDPYDCLAKVSEALKRESAKNDRMSEGRIDRLQSVLEAIFREREQVMLNVNRIEQSLLEAKVEFEVVNRYYKILRDELDEMRRETETE